MCDKPFRNVLSFQYNNYLITQDIETFDLEDFKYNFVNITAFRLVDADDVGVRSVLRDMERFQPAGNTILNKSRVIQASVISQFFLCLSNCYQRCGVLNPT